MCIEVSDSDQSKEVPANVCLQANEGSSQASIQEQPTVQSSRHQSISGPQIEGAPVLHGTQSLPRLTPAAISDSKTNTASDDFNTLMKEVSIEYPNFYAAVLNVG